MDTYLSSAKFLTLSKGTPDEQLSVGLSTDPKPASDEYLMSRLQKGESEAIAQLFKRHAGAIYRLGQKVLRDSGEADDLVQEVFLYIYRKSGMFDRLKGSARSWIFQIAYTQAFIRRRYLRARGYYSSARSDEPSASETSCSLKAAYDHTVEGLFGKNGWREILESLTENQRETLKLHFFEGYTFEEIAEKLGQSYANVRNHHYRGLEKLRIYLAENAWNGR